MEKLILGFVGEAGSGKGTAAQYLHEHYGAAVFGFSGSLRDIIRRLHLEESRDHIIKLSEILRGAFGEDVLSRVIAHDALGASSNLVAVEGIRRPQDIVTLQELPHFILVAVDASAETRFARLSARGQNTDDAMTWEQFLAMQERSTERSIHDVMPLATERIDNNGTPQELEQQIEALLDRVGYERSNS